MRAKDVVNQKHNDENDEQVASVVTQYSASRVLHEDSFPKLEFCPTQAAGGTPFQREGVEASTAASPRCLPSVRQRLAGKHSGNTT
jgi:hypothetical protein